MTTLLKPGVHDGISFEDYCLDPGVNATTLKAFAGRTPKHARLALEEPQEDTQSLVIGHAAHTAVLEPDLFDTLYAAYPKSEYVEQFGHPNSKAYKAARDAWYAKHEDACIMTDEEHEAALRIRKAVMGHGLARSLLVENKGKPELTVIVEQDETRLKGRIDRLTSYNGYPAIVDLKTINPMGDVLRPHVVERYLHRYAIHIQMAWYLDLLNAHAEADRMPVIVFVENVPPHDVAVYPVDDAAIEQGRREARSYLHQLKQCRESGYWPGYAREMQGPIGLPQYAQAGDLDS
jgi:hypothetical protein